MRSTFLLLLSLLFLTSCNSDSGSSAFSPLDGSGGGTTTGTGTCDISSSTPSTSTIRVASSTTSSTTFGIVTGDSSCVVDWKLNGSTISGTTLFQVISSSSLTTGINTLVATASNGKTTATRSWIINKNNPPVCASQTPASTGNSTTYTSSIGFMMTATDPESDSVTFSWRLNGNTSALFTTTSSTGYSANATLTPNLASVGNGQVVTANISDGYDTAQCTWSLNIIDPGGVTIDSCTPTSNPVVITSSGGASSQTLMVSATGSSLTYQWQKDSVVVGGASSPSLNLTAGALSVGTYVYRVDVTNPLTSSTGNCQWNVKRNAAPAIGALSPAAGTYKVAYDSSLAFSVTATDANSDSLTYTWTLDGVANAALPSGSASTIFSPASNLSLLGSHTVMVSISDGTETTTQSWTVEVNTFSTYCNDIYNGSVATQGGKICTLVGSPSVGDGLNPVSDQSKMRIGANGVALDGNNLIIADNNNMLIWYYNRGGSSVTRFGVSIPANQMKVVAGRGGVGTGTSGTASTLFKFRDIAGLAYDSVSERLYINEYNSGQRIVYLDSTGNVTTILGNGTGTNNLANNTDGALGTAHACAQTNGMRIANFGAVRNLFAACYNNVNAIKRVVIDPLHADYGKAYIVVGRLSGGATTTASTNGSAGSTGTASTNGPFDMDFDTLGNMYFGDLGTGLLRVAALGGADLTFFGGAASFTGTLNHTLTFTDNSGGGWSTTATTGMDLAATPGASYAFGIVGPARAVNNECVPLYVQYRNNSGLVYKAPSLITVNVADGGGGGTFYSDSTCATGLGASTTIASGASITPVVYYKKATAGTVTLSATSGGITTGNLSLQFAASGGSLTNMVAYAPNTTNRFAFKEASSVDHCIPVVIQYRDASNVPVALASNRDVLLTQSLVGSYYNNSSCSGTPIVSSTVVTGTSIGLVYFSTKAKVLSGYVATIAGNGTNNVTNPATASVPEFGLVGLRTSAIRVYEPTAGTVEGFFIGNWDHNRISFVNTSGVTKTFGGTSVENADTGTVLNYAGTNSFSEDIGQSAMSGRIPQMDLSSDKNTLYFVDAVNYRLRTLDLSTNNGLTSTLVGAGRIRSGHVSDSATNALAFYLDRPGQISIDATGKKLYIADELNRRIRQTDLVTGQTSTVIGRGTGNPSVENEDPTNVYLRRPRAAYFYNSGANTFLFYSDTEQGTGMNQGCMVRALNLTGPTATLFGQSITAGRVRTVLGDYTKGCNTWNFTAAGPPAQVANTTGDSGVNIRTYNVESVAVDSNGNMYSANYNDHCVLKTDTSGATTQRVGLCGTAGLVNGSTAVSRLRFPTGVWVDQNYASDGNLFIADQVDQTASYVRYVNFRTSGSVVIGGVTVSAAPDASNGTIANVFQLNITGSSGRIYAITQFGNQLCYAAGDESSTSTGGHNVTCRDLSSLVGAITLRVGPDEVASTNRGGLTKGQEEEGVLAGNASLYAPNGLAFDSAGNLYISERRGHQIRMVRRWF